MAALENLECSARTMNGTFGARGAVKTFSVSLAVTIEASGRDAEKAVMAKDRPSALGAQA